MDVPEEVLNRADTVGNEFLTRFDSVIGQLSEKLGVAADHFWPVFVRQQVVAGVAEMCAMMVLSIITFSASITVFRWIKRDPEFEDDGTRAAIVVVTGVIGALIAVLSVVVNVTHIFNPEYHALKDLVEMIGIGN